MSVVVPTYQHAAFIEKCIDSILAQRTTFPVEILIGEDESSDGTREICERLAEKHPDRIRLFLGARKDVLFIDGQPTGRRNLLNLLNEARGVHIALCEGDDHWVDDHKLQKQVEALEADDTCVGCFTDAWNEHKGDRTNYIGGDYAKHAAPLCGQREMALGQNIPTCTFVFKRDRLFPLPEVLWRSPVGDTILYVHLTRKGHLLYLPEHTAVRVMHAGGKHSLKSAMHKLRTGIKVSQLIDEMTEGKYRAELQQKITNMRLHGWQLATGEQDKDAMREWWKVVSADPKNGWGLVTKWRNYLKAWYPRAERVLAGIMGR